MTAPAGEPRWDWVATALVVLALVVLLALTFDLWVPHFGSHQ